MEPLISIVEAARLLGRSWDFVADRKVEFRAVRQGRVYGIPPAAVEEFKAKNAVKPEKRRVLPFRKTANLNRAERRAAVDRLWSQVVNKRRSA